MTRLNTSDPTYHPGQRLNTSDDSAHGGSCCSSPSACSALLTAYAETCRHIEELERIQAGSKQMVFTIEAKKLAALLIERILVLTPNAGGDAHGNR